MNSSISLDRSLGDDIEDFHEKISMHEPSSDVGGIYSFQTKLLTASDLKKLETKHQEFFKTFSKKSFHIDYISLVQSNPGQEPTTSVENSVSARYASRTSASFEYKRRQI